MRRRLERWRFSVTDGNGFDQAGEVLEGSADGALERVALAHGGQSRTSFHYWHTGGHATYGSRRGELTVVVVVTDPKRTDHAR